MEKTIPEAIADLIAAARAAERAQMDAVMCQTATDHAKARRAESTLDEAEESLLATLLENMGGAS